VIHDLYPTTAEVSNDLQRWFRSNTRLGIPVLLVEEGLHGFNRADSTAFPQCIGLGATFDPGLVERIGAAIAAEMRAVGVHLSLSPVLCLARDPRWGRTEETFGEDPWLVGSMGEAYVRGMQGNLGPLNVVAERNILPAMEVRKADSIRVPCTSANAKCVKSCSRPSAPPCRGQGA
jgi:beta-glucosidase-like glycosyl hydrolase